MARSRYGYKKRMQITAEDIAVFEAVKAELEGYNIQSVSDISGVSTPTLYFWLDGTTRWPRLNTIVKVARAMGYELVLKRVSGSKVKKQRHLRLVK